MKIRDLFKDEYAVKARFLPAILTAVPFGFLIAYPFSEYVLSLKDGLEIVSKCTFYTSLAGSVLIITIFVWAFLVRLIAKFIELIVFKDELSFPTTKLLMWGNAYYTKDIKEKIHQRIKKDFGVQLSNESEEEADQVEAATKIARVVARIRDKVKDGRIVLQYNIHYGAVRNLTAGSIISLVASALLVWMGYSNNSMKSAMDVGIVLSLGYMIVLATAKFTWAFLGKLYAKELIDEYMSSECNNLNTYT